MADDWDALALEVKAETEAQSVKRNLSGALDVNPDKQAEINRLSEKSGVPTFSIDSPENEAWVRSMTRMNDLNPDEMVKTHPMTAKALQDENFAKIAHDDVENIKNLEDSFSVIGKRKTSFEAIKAGYSSVGVGMGAIAESLLRAPDTIGRFGNFAQESLPRGSGLGNTAAAMSIVGRIGKSIGMNTAADKVGSFFDDLQKVHPDYQVLTQKGQDFEDAMALAQSGDYSKIGDVLSDPAAWASAIGGAVPSLGVAIASGGGIPVTVVLEGLSEANNAADFEKKTGVKISDSDFSQAVAQVGIINGILEKAGIDRILKSKGIGEILISGLSEAGTEGLQQFNQNLAEYFSYDKNKNLSEGVLPAIMGGAGSGVSFSGAKVGADALKKRIDDKYINIISEEKRNEVERLHDAAMKVKTVQRDPAAVRAMVEAANPDSRVYIDGAVATKYFQELDAPTKALLTEAIPDIEERIAEANLSGSDVMLNRSDYVAYIASNEGGKVVMEHVKFDRPDDLTVAQLTDPNYLESLYDLSPKDKTPLTDIEAFREELTNKLRDTGRIGTQQIARESVAPLASFIQTMRERGGSEAVTQSLLQGIDVQGPVSPFKSTVDITDKTINDMREYKTRTDTLFNAREKSLETRREKAKAKAKAEGRLYIEPKGRSGKPKRHLPVLKYLAQSGGVKVGSPLAGELKNMDVTPKTAPWLFVKEDKKTVTAQGVVTQKALSDLDGIDSQDINETIGLDVFRNSGTSSTDKTGYYVDSQDILDAIDSELRGNPVVPEATDPMEAAFEDFNQYLESLGLSLDTATNEQIKQAINDPAAFLGENVTGENAPDGKTFNQSAFHGSPYRFDKFTLDHIGSGEGAQAYGWGLYFAGKKEVAEWYKDKLSKDQKEFVVRKSDGSESILRESDLTTWEAEALSDIARYGYDEALLLNKKGRDRDGLEEKFQTLFLKYSRIVSEIERLGDGSTVTKRDAGQLYEVEIPDNDVLLDWDKPLSKQPKSVRDALSIWGYEVNEKDIAAYDDALLSALTGDGDTNLPNKPDDPTGEEIYRRMNMYVGRNRSDLEKKFGPDVWGRADKISSELLNDSGIKGIKYLDGTSRRKDEGSYNYVIFDDSAIKTLQTYYQNNRGQVSIMQDGRYVVKLFETSNLSTFLHETGHIFLDAYNRYAEAPDAPDQFKTDMAGIFEYLGVKSYSEIGVEQHEKFARAFENYLRAGEAPSVALQSAFQKFKAWLSRIYQTIQELRAPVTPELKAIFDRMLATDSEIEMVQSNNDGFNLNEDLLAILPKDAQERYRKLHNKALEQAKEKLLKKSLREKEREQTQAWKDERAKLRAEIELQVNTDPIYRTMEFLKTGKYHEGDEWVEMPPVKIARDDAIKHVGKTIMTEKMKGMTAKNGISADALSQMMGYVVGNGEQGYRHGTGYELLYTIANAEDRKARIERLTNETMIERHGDLMTDGSIENAAIEAWNNDAQALKMEMEGKAAAQLAGLPFGSNTNFELAAQKILASKNVRDATNVDRFYVASVRAAKAYGKAIRSKNYPVAVKAKQQQLLSHHLYKQSLQARRALDKSLESWKRLQKTDEKLSKSMDLNYIYVARAILGRYGVLPYDAGNLQTYFAYIQQEDPEAYEDLILAVQENTRNIPQAETRDVEYTKGKLAGRTVTQTFQPWTKLSLEEFLALKDTIDNVLGVGRNQKVMTVDGQKIERQAVLDELQARLDELPETSIATGQEKALEWHDKGKLAISGIFAGMRRVENWVNVMDGQYGGVFRKYVWNPINDARGQYLEAKHEYLTKMAELLKPHDENLNGSGEIFAYEIGYKFHSKAELIGMILHMGNESNWYKLWKGGRGKSWNPENVQSMMDRMMKDGTITKTDMDLVQSMWDLVEELKPAAQKAHRSMYGYYFSEITSWPVPTPWGEYRGGYWPAIPDNNLSQDARIRQDKENLITVNNSSMFPSTGRGFTKSREEGYAAPLSFDLRLLPSHVDKVLRFVHLETAVKDVAKLANDKKFRMAMDRIDPRAIEDMLIPWLQRVARQTVETNDSKWFKYIDPAARWLRASTSAQAMMLNLLNAVQQVTGFAPAMYKVGARPLGRALVQYMKNPKAAHEKIYEASSFMRYRNTILADNMQKAVIDIVLDTSKYAKVKDAAQAHGYIFQKIFQSWVDGTTWMAAYDNALAKNMNEKEAVRYADSIVRETQGSTSAEDLSKFEAGPATMRLFTMFYSYFNTQGNLITAEAQNIIRSTSGLDKTKKLGYLYLMAFAVPSFMAELIVKGLKGDLPDDEDDDGSELDDWLAWFTGSQLRYATAMVPFAGQVINSAVNAFDDKPYNDKIALSPVVGMAETLARTPKSIYQAVTDDGDVSRAIQNTLTSLGFVTGLPLGQLGKPLGYAADVAEGDTEIDSPLDPLRGIVAGPPPADKR